MTFEEWFKKETGFGPSDKNDPGDVQLIECWNAAIAAAMKTLKAKHYEFNVHPEEDIKQLLSK